jgi:pentatricopeptide repeat protein
VVGTPAYMPPEQAAGRIAEVGPAADVYAIGAMLYELIAGHAPYCGPGEDSSGSAVLRRIVGGEPAPLVASKVPPELLAIITKAMAHDWRKRYASVQELAADLGAFVEQRVVKAYASGPWAEMRQWTRRNRGVAAGIATTLAALIAGIIGTTTQAATATTMTREAVKQASTKETALEFLVQAFRQADPARSGAEYPRSDDILKTAVGQLAQVGDHEARCVIAASLAEIYMHRGEPALAREILVETLSSMSSLHVKPAEACYVWNQLASACVELDRFDEADEIYKKLRDLFAASPSLADRWQYGLDANYGNLLVKTGRATEAEPLLRRAVEHASQSHGPDAAKTMAVRNNMASCLASLSRHNEAVAEYHQIIAILEGRDNERGPRLLWAKMALSQSLWQIGRRSEAIATVQEVDAVVANLGDLGVEGIQLRVNAASMLGTCGAHTEAVARLVQMMPSASAALPEGHSTLRSLLRNLGHSLCALSDFEGASKAYEQVLPLDREAEGDSGLGTISSQLGVAWVEVHRAGGANLEIAAQHYEHILHACASVRGSRGDEIASARGGLGLVRLRQGHPEKAEPLFQEALADRRRLNPQDPRIEKILVLLVDCQRRLGRVAEAMSAVDELIASTPQDSPELVARKALREELLLQRR